MRTARAPFSAKIGKVRVFMVDRCSGVGRVRQESGHPCAAVLGPGSWTLDAKGTRAVVDCDHVVNVGTTDEALPPVHGLAL